MTNADHRRSENSGGIIEPAVIACIDEMIRARGDDYARLIEDRRESRRVRKHTPAQREKERTRKQLARQQQTPEQRSHAKERERVRSRQKLCRFMAVDGEGGGTDRLGRQHYLLMVAAGTTGGTATASR